ncbi:hypothetical protein B0H12DRAFT_250461 [Mycena haematopus]|nr:hypothetical protein B0H12DRAFT_250461 [Mycena haematopus]
MHLSAHTTLLIAVVAAVGGLIVVLLLLFCLCRRPAHKVPLPPKQELARYREQQTVHVEPRPTTWYDSALLSAPSGSFAGSKSSLLPPSRGGSPSRRPSLNTSESPSEDISDVPMHHGLELPHLSFDTSSTSLSTAETDSPASSPPPTASLSDQSLSHTPRHPSSSSRPNRRPRPISVGSNGSSAISRQSRNNARNIPTVRGVPHGPHSQVQIVLPAPLAFNSDRLSVHGNSSRLSMVDQWAPPTVRSEGNPIPRPQRRSLSGPEPRRASQSTLAQPPINASEARRSVSASAASPLPQRQPPSREHSSPSSTPPVPQIPQQWLPPSGNLTGIAEHARSRDPGSATAALPPPEPVDRPPPTNGQRRRSRSRG